MARSSGQLRLHTLIAVFVSGVVVLSLSVTGILIGVQEANKTYQALSDKVMNIAEMISYSPLVVDALDGKQSRSVVEPFASEVRKATNVPFIVVMDMNHIRLSHPVADRIGEHFVGGDENRAMHGASYISVAKGTLGTSLRAFVPVYGPTGAQVGVVAVGILMNEINTDVARSERIIYIGTGLGLFIGIGGAILLARRIRKVLFGLEPHEIAKVYQERTALLESVREGILAADTDGKILVANAEAVRIFQRAGMRDYPVGQDVSTYFGSNIRFSRILLEGTAEYDVEHDLNGTSVVLNQVPITVDEKVVGVVATFRDKTDLKQLAEQLTGVKLYANALRAQTHEFMNKLHAMVGMAHIGQFDRLTSYIRDITQGFQLEVGSVSHLVKDPVLAGFLISKLSYARERNVQFDITGDKVLPRPRNPQCINDVITIIGNLLDNAFEAVEGGAHPEVSLWLTHDSNVCHFAITDSGSGVAHDSENDIFAKGYSTKGEYRGFGLFLAKCSVERLGGYLTLESSAQGTTFAGSVPWVGVQEMVGI